MKENLKPCVYKHTEGYERSNAKMPDVVLFVERSGELLYVVRLSCSAAEPEGNRALRARAAGETPAG